jgi:hypothetical protein
MFYPLGWAFPGRAVNESTPFPLRIVNAGTLTNASGSFAYSDMCVPPVWRIISTLLYNLFRFYPLFEFFVYAFCCFFIFVIRRSCFCGVLFVFVQLAMMPDDF